jgi:hypothetical protein
VIALALAASLSWEATFAVAGPEALTVVAVVQDRQGKEHRLHLWREEKRLRRDSDEARIFGDRRSGEETYLVEKRGANLGYRVRRADLHRLQMFTGWDSLASLLQRPPAGATVERLPGRPAKTPHGACRWFEVVGAGVRVCWSAAHRLPLEVREQRDGAWKSTLRIEELKAGAIDAVVFAEPRGLNVIDVDERMDRLGD